MKNTLDEIDGRLDKAEDRVSDFGRQGSWKTPNGNSKKIKEFKMMKTTLTRWLSWFSVVLSTNKVQV